MRISNFELGIGIGDWKMGSAKVKILIFISFVRWPVQRTPNTEQERIMKRTHVLLFATGMLVAIFIYLFLPAAAVAP